MVTLRTVPYTSLIAVFAATAAPGAAQIPAAEVVMGGPGGPPFTVLRELDADATGSWAVSASLSPQFDQESLYGFLVGSGMTEPGLIREPRTIGGYQQTRLAEPSVRGAQVAYIALEASGQVISLWIDDEVIARPGDNVGSQGLTWRRFFDVQLTEDGRTFAFGNCDSDGSVVQAIAEYPAGNVLLQAGESVPGLGAPILGIGSMHVSRGGQHWAAIVACESSVPGQVLTGVVVDGAVHTFFTGDLAIAGARPPFAPLGGSQEWTGFSGVRVTDSGEVVIDGVAGFQRSVVRNGRRIQVVQDPFGALADADSDGAALVKSNEGDGLPAQLDGLSLGRAGVFLADVDRDGEVDLGWQVFDSPALIDVTAFGAGGRVLMGALLGSPDNQQFDLVVVDCRLAQPYSTLCPGEASSLGRPVNLRVTGSDRASLNDLTLTIADLPPLALGIPLFSTGTDFVPLLGGGLGTLCLSGAIGRGAPVVGGARYQGNRTARLLTQAIPQPTGPVIGLPGETWNVQVWYRDQIPGTVATTNLSDAVSITLRE